MYTLAHKMRVGLGTERQIASPELLKLFEEFKTEFNQVLINKNCKDIVIKHKEFYFVGYFTNLYGMPFYFSVGDLRQSTTMLMYRRTDYYDAEIGGNCEYAFLDNLEETLKIN